MVYFNDVHNKTGLCFNSSNNYLNEDSTMACFKIVREMKHEIAQPVMTQALLWHCQISDIY